MVAIASLLVIIALSLLVTRVATVILTATGLSRESARFQARSALTGTGFTTRESESIVAHPVRRRVVFWLMLFGSAGTIAVISSLILGFVRSSGLDSGLRVAQLVGGLFLLVLLSRSHWVDRRLNVLIARALRRFADLDAWDYAGLLQLSEGYRVIELRVNPDGWVASRTLRELGLREEGVAVLGVNRADGGFLGTPAGDTAVEAGDTLILYGRGEHLRELDRRPKGLDGDRAHRQAVARNKQLPDRPGRDHDA